MEIFLSLLALFVSFAALWHQRGHDRLSVRPLGVIELIDFDDFIKIKVRNAGIGPMIITRVETLNSVKNELRKYPFEWFQDEPYYWDNYKMPGGDWVLAVGDEMVLLHYSIKPIDDQSEEQRKKDILSIRDKLKDLTIYVYYKDIYNKEQDPAVKDLTWFGRKNRK